MKEYKIDSFTYGMAFRDCLSHLAVNLVWANKVFNTMCLTADGGAYRVSYCWTRRKGLTIYSIRRFNRTQSLDDEEAASFCQWAGVDYSIHEGYRYAKYNYETIESLIRLGFIDFFLKYARPSDQNLLHLLSEDNRVVERIGTILDYTHDDVQDMIDDYLQDYCSGRPVYGLECEDLKILVELSSTHTMYVALDSLFGTPHGDDIALAFLGSWRHGQDADRYIENINFGELDEIM
jgi:hypothetical protein